MESSSQPINSEFARGIAFSLGIIDGVADGVRNNPSVTHAERVAIEKALTIISLGLRDAIKDLSNAKPV